MIDLLLSVTDRHGFDGAEMYTPIGWSSEWLQLEANGLVSLEPPTGKPTDLHLRYDVTPAGMLAVMAFDK